MSIPTQMAGQTGERISLLKEMIAEGAIAIPLEYLNIPAILVASIDDSQLVGMHKRLKKTRKKYIPFGLNGRVFLPTRRQALDIVKQEIKLRGENAA